jgi:hypothetical protein
MPVDVRVHPVDRSAGVFAVGAIARSLVQARFALARGARLRLVGLDHESCIFGRLFLGYDAIVDVAAERISIHVAGGIPQTIVLRLGGASVTRGIAFDLSIDPTSAERRKRILGCAGAGAASHDELIAAVAGAIERLRGRSPISRIALTGNGARLPSFLNDLHLATGAIVEMLIPEVFDLDIYPMDVLRSAAPDWSLAAGLLSWSGVD